MLIVIAAILIGCTFLKTPEIKGVVVDAETGKPIEGARIYAKWQKTVSSPGGKTSGGISKELRLQTKEDGGFVIPAYTLKNHIPYPFGHGGSFYIIVYAHGYKSDSFTFLKTSDFEKPAYAEFANRINDDIRVKLREIKDDQVSFHQLGEQLDITGDDYYLHDMRFFIDKYSSSAWSATVQSYIAQYYAERGDYSTAIGEYEALIKKYPKDGFVPIARKAIEEMKKKKRERNR